MDLQQLRKETRQEHEATEAAMPLMAPDLDRETYAAVLARLLPVIAGWERWAREHAPADVGLMLESRLRSHLLEQDLRALGGARAAAAVSASAFPAIDWMAVVTGGPATGTAAVSADPHFRAGFLGALYVLEGSTLGGRYIARHVEGTLQLQPGEGNAYFQGHGEATGRLWRETTAQISALPQEYAAEVIGAARRTFAAFGRALQEPAVVQV